MLSYLDGSVRNSAHAYILKEKEEKTLNKSKTTAKSVLAQCELHNAGIIPKTCSDLYLTLLISLPSVQPDSHSGMKMI